jgi:arylsulfate sulfotransferase
MSPRAKSVPHIASDHRLVRLAAFVAVLSVSLCSHALNILSGPSVSGSSLAPLAGVLRLSTDVPARVSVAVNDGTNAWTRNFYDYTNIHAVTLLGFKPGRTNAITVTVTDQFHNQVTAGQPVVFVTSPLPSDFPPSVLLASKPDQMEPGYTLLRLVNNNTLKGYLTIVDNTGGVVWYSTASSVLDVRQLANGNLFLPLTTSFVEYNMLGQTVRTWPVPPNGWNIDIHDAVPTPHGTILYLNDASTIVHNFPTSSTNPAAPLLTTNVFYNRVVEIATTNSTALLNSWSLINMLQPTRINYLTFTIRTSMGWDCEHANAVIEDPRDDSLIVSMRHQDAVVKFSRDGQLKWILGPHANWATNFQQYLLTPVGTPFQWNYAQHAPALTPQGTLLLYDNGDFRASPFDTTLADSNNWSRAVEYAINEQTMEVTQVWEYGRTNGAALYTDKVGNADWLPHTGNVLITFGNVNYVDGLRPSAFSPTATMVRIKEVTHDPTPEVVFDLVFFDYTNRASNYKGSYAYRSHRIPDLYAHPAMPVVDLTIQCTNGYPTLLFSGDEAWTYIVQTSDDLANWEDLGPATPLGNGDYIYEEEGGSPARYYRVATQERRVGFRASP